MPVLYHIKGKKLFEREEGILPRILGLEKKNYNEATEICIV